jgi:hypothetical protein
MRKIKLVPTLEMPGFGTNHIYEYEVMPTPDELIAAIASQQLRVEHRDAHSVEFGGEDFTTHVAEWADDRSLCFVVYNSEGDPIAVFPSRPYIVQLRQALDASGEHD